MQRRDWLLPDMGSWEWEKYVKVVKRYKLPVIKFKIPGQVMFSMVTSKEYCAVFVNLLYWKLSNLSNLKIAKSVDLKSSHYFSHPIKFHNKFFVIKKMCNNVWWCVLIRFIIVIISEYTEILNNYLVHLKLLYSMSTISHSFKKDSHSFSLLFSSYEKHKLFQVIRNYIKHI